jgi:CCR4-NOT transcription complex subunit 7/8
VRGAQDVVFPGVILRPLQDFSSAEDYVYAGIRANVNCSPCLELGLTLSDGAGALPEESASFRFRLRFDQAQDAGSLKALEKLAAGGSDLRSSRDLGVERGRFAALMTSSGLVLQGGVWWITYAGGFDLAHVIRVLSGAPLPPKREEFLALVRLWLPNLIDVRSMLDAWRDRPRLGEAGGVGTIADAAAALGLSASVAPATVGTNAGIDSRVTAALFFKLRDTLGDAFRPEAFSGHIYGLLPDLVSSTSSSSTSSSAAAPSSSSTSSSTTTTTSSSTAASSTATAAAATAAPPPAAQGAHGAHHAADRSGQRGRGGRGGSAGGGGRGRR